MHKQHYLVMDKGYTKPFQRELGSPSPPSTSNSPQPPGIIGPDNSEAGAVALPSDQCEVQQKQTSEEEDTKRLCKNFYL